MIGVVNTYELLLKTGIFFLRVKSTFGNVNQIEIVGIPFKI